MPDILPLSFKVKPEGSSGYTSQVSISGPLFITGIEILLFDLSIYSDSNQKISSGGRLLIVISIIVVE